MRQKHRKSLEIRKPNYFEPKPDLPTKHIVQTSTIMNALIVTIISQHNNIYIYDKKLDEHLF